MMHALADRPFFCYNGEKPHVLAKGARMDRLLLVDGHNLLFQMFFGMPARIVNRAGKSIGGTLGFVGALLRMMRLVQPSHVAVLFDGEHENLRAALDPDYKSNRPDWGEVPQEESPFSQLPDVYAALDYLGICHTETTLCETDDLIAAYARTWAQSGEVVIASFDSDFFQLLSDRVSLLRYRGEKTVICTPAFLREKFDIEPRQYADFKSLVGDTADHIRGATHIGPKTAAKLLHEFDTLDNLLTHAGDIPRPALRETLTQEADRLRTNHRLICLDGKAANEPLLFTKAQLCYTPSGQTAFSVLEAIGLRP